MIKPFVSIIIPTFNRSEMLTITLDSFLSQNYGKENFEIIISDNNSTDNTSKVIKSYIDKSVNITSTFVKKQGVHYARNSAALLAKGEILYFTDDDMIADKNLLTKIIEVFNIDTRVAVVTGKITAKFESKEPLWVRKHLINSFLSLTDNSRKENLIISSEDIGVYSCHQAIKKEVFFSAGGFNPENTAGVWLGDGETGLNIKIKKLGVYFAYFAESKIEHIIPKNRTTLKYLISRIGNEGYCRAYTEYRIYKSKKKLLQNIVYINLLDLLIIQVKYIILILIGRKNIRFILAFPFFYFKKSVYELKLLTNVQLREVVLIDDWIKNMDKEIKLKDD
ncbi:glycosyltransferase family 2 protein [Candidatus Thioglobus sp.]|nr:glycosyltransferase family 2 protein [Candidatus Thioglobus sp.]